MMTDVWNSLIPCNIPENMFHDWYVNILAWASVVVLPLLVVGFVVFVIFWIKDIRDNFKYRNNSSETKDAIMERNITASIDRLAEQIRLDRENRDGEQNESESSHD